MDARMLDGDQIMGSNAGDATLGQAMHGYVVPIFLDLLFLTTWAMTAMKAMGGAFGSGGQAKAGWCRMLCLVLCVFQSFYGFMVTHSLHQKWALLMMIFPLVGFIAFNGNNPKWLLGYVAVNLFTYNFSGLNSAQLAWNSSTWETPNELKPTWDWSEDLKSPCWTYDGHNSFCKYGWVRTLYVFSSFNLFACYFTTFAAFSWYAEGTIKDSQGGPPAM